MPFKSKSQLRTCYNKNDPNWDCDRFLSHTNNICDLPNNLNSKPTTHKRNVVSRTKTRTFKGPKGGTFFYIIEKFSNGDSCRTKVYK